MKLRKPSKDIIYCALLILSWIFIAYLCEVIARRDDTIGIYEDPAQVQIYDDDRGKLPYVESITGRILPCGKYQSKTRHRKCVIEFKVKRMAELRKRNLTRDELYKYSHLEVGTGTVKYPTP